MQTLFLLGAAYLLLGNSKPSSGGGTTPPPPPPQQNYAGGADLGAAFGAFVGSLIAAASSDKKP